MMRNLIGGGVPTSLGTADPVFWVLAWVWLPARP